MKLFKLLSIDDKTCIIQMPHESTNFRFIVVKSYYLDDTRQKKQFIFTTQQDIRKEELFISDALERQDTLREDNSFLSETMKMPSPEEQSSENQSIRKERDRSKAFKNKTHLQNDTFLINKKQADKEFSLQLRKNNRIIIADKSFEKFDGQKIENLIDRRVFSFESLDQIKYEGVRIFDLD
jgi:hypothetical protein